MLRAPAKVPPEIVVAGVNTFAERFAAVQARIARAARTWGRDPATIRVIGVTKLKPARAIEEALEAGLVDIGENFVQEALGKMDALAGRGATWHFIGAIQSNKTRSIAERFDWVHTVDRAKIARRLSAQRPSDAPALNVLIQVHLGDEDTKSGAAPGEVLELAREIRGLPGLEFRGLMAVPPPEEDFERQRGWFRQLRTLAGTLGEAGVPAEALSMGMSGDLEAAIAEGATHVRIGTALFGERTT